MNIGIFARTFARGRMDEALDAVLANGISAIQFNMSLIGGPSLPAEISAATSELIRAAVAQRDLSMAAVSGTYNMAHPDRAVRADGAARLATLIEAAPRLGTPVVTLCTGSRDPEDMWRAHRGNALADAWQDARDSIAQALEVAECHDVLLAFEPELGNVVADARAGRRLLDELGSDRLRVVIDAANLIRPGELDQQASTLRQAFALLGDEIVLAHAKDVAADGSIVAAGLGGLDYPLYLSLLEATGYRGPVVLHGLPESDVPRAMRYLTAQLPGAASPPQ
jgi:sugar phosphate isomerase/epimerase